MPDRQQRIFITRFQNANRQLLLANARLPTENLYYPFSERQRGISVNEDPSPDNSNHQQRESLLANSKTLTENLCWPILIVNGESSLVIYNWLAEILHLPITDHYQRSLVGKRRISIDRFQIIDGKSLSEIQIVNGKSLLANSRSLTENLPSFYHNIWPTYASNCRSGQML